MLAYGAEEVLMSKPKTPSRLQVALEGFYAFLDRPLYFWTRPVLVLLVILLVIGLFLPLWHIQLWAPQYPEGLSVDVYSYALQSGRGGADLAEINILNHYIGMHKLDRAQFAELDWLPLAFGAVALLVLRVAVLGNVRALVDLAVLVAYFAGFSAARFAFQMYTLGHDLSPDAPVKVAPFMPAIWGEKKIGNFSTWAGPGSGSFLIAALVVGVAAITLYHLIQGRREARARGTL